MSTGSDQLLMGIHGRENLYLGGLGVLRLDGAQNNMAYFARARRITGRICVKNFVTDKIFKISL